MLTLKNSKGDNIEEVCPQYFLNPQFFGVKFVFHNYMADMIYKIFERCNQRFGEHLEIIKSKNDQIE